jgi:hypothetical protein
MAEVRCPFCHEFIDEAAFPAHADRHLKTRPDGQQTDYATLPPEDREQGDLAGVPRVYVHRRCGAATGMPEEIIRSYLKNPFLYGADETFCTGCRRHVPQRECVWIETGENLQTYMDGLRAAAGGPGGGRAGRGRGLLGAGALALAACVVAFFCVPFIVQALRGPRTITEAELLSLREPGDWDNYVRFRPASPAADTGVRYGKKGNEGTKYVIIPVRDRLLFCSARIDDHGPEYVGRLSYFGDTEREAVGYATRQTGPRKILPLFLQSVRSIWFDTVFALAVIIGCLVGAARTAWPALRPA